jgi:hypothetical protein
MDISWERNLLRALVNTLMNLSVPYVAGKFLGSCATGALSRRSQFHGVSQYIARFGSNYLVPYGLIVGRLPMYVSNVVLESLNCILR